MLRLQRYSFRVVYKPGASLVLADTLSRAPVSSQYHEAAHEDFVYRTELESDIPDMSQFQDCTLDQIQSHARNDPQYLILRPLVANGWPDSKAQVPPLARPYWSYRHELNGDGNLLFKGTRVVIPVSLRTVFLDKLHHAHRGADFTLRHARDTVFWPGISAQITNLCEVCDICARHARQHQKEPLKPLPAPTLPWQLVSQDLFELHGTPYLVTVDHYSDFYEIDQLPDTLSTTVINATAAHFARYGCPHTLISDNGPQFVSEAFKQFARDFSFRHITSSPYWSQSNGRAEAAVKSAKLLLAKSQDISLALLSVRNTPPAGHAYSPAQRLMSRVTRSDLPVSALALAPSPPPLSDVVSDILARKQDQKTRYDKRAGPSLTSLEPGTYVYARPPPSSTNKAWIPARVTGSAGPRSYNLETGGREIRRNRAQIRVSPSPSVHPSDRAAFDKNVGTVNRPTSVTPSSSLPQVGPPPSAIPCPTTHSSSNPADTLPCSPSADPHPTIHNPPQPQNSPRTTTRSGRVTRLPVRFRE